ncbi:MAG: sulfite exporter TauE/SafE family protein [Nitrospirota bacterium]
MSDSDFLIIAIVLSAVSFLAGFVDSIAGGGGLLLLPALLLAGLPPQTALGTNKFASSIGTAVALANFVRNKKVIWKIAIIGLGFSLAGGMIGSEAVLLFKNETVGKIITFLLPLAVIGSLIPRKERVTVQEFSSVDFYIKVPLIAFLLGFYDGFFGPGAGSFLIIALYLLIGLDLVYASGTAKVFNLASCASAAVIFFMEGKVLILLGLPLALANIAGNFFGSTLAIKIGSRVVRIFLVFSLVVLFISLLWKYFLSK